MNKSKGISMIVLVITIIVIIILAGAVILSLAKNNPIAQSNEAKFKADLATIQQEVNLTILSKAANQVGNIKMEDEDGPIANYSTAANPNYITKLSVINGKVVINGQKASSQEVTWGKQLGLIIGDYQDNVAPVITLNNEIVYTTKQGQTYTEPGAIVTDNMDTDIQNKLVITSNIDINTVGTYTVKYNVSDSNDNKATELSRTVIVSPSVDTLAFTGSYQTWTAPFTGKALLQVWGATGGNDAAAVGAKGGYSQGEYNVTQGQVLYVYVGGRGVGGSVNSGGGYNGGGNAGPIGSSGGGGGATDIRTVSGVWNEINSLNSRIIVAGGGGGAGVAAAGYAPLSVAGPGGGLTGGNGLSSTTNGATQTAGGTSTYGNGALGQGANHTNDGGGGGGGYYGGGAGNGDTSAGGGSGYIGGVQNGQTRNSNWEGNGYVKITKLS